MAETATTTLAPPPPSPFEEGGGSGATEAPSTKPPADPPNDPEEGNPRQNIPCDAIQLPAPTVTATFVAPNSIRVGWSDVRTHECEGDINYEVTGPGLDITTSVHSATATGLSAGTHCYTVSVVGGGSGNDCETVPDDICAIITATISAARKSDTSANVSWGHSSTGTCPSIVYDVSGPGLNLTGTTSTSAMPSGLANCAAYSYGVTVRETGSNPASGGATATVPACACDITSAEINADPGRYTMGLNWSHEDNGRCEPVTYTVTRRGTTILENTTSKSTTDRNLACEHPYTYQLKVSGNGDSASDTVSARTTACPDRPPPPPPPPSGPRPPGSFAATATSASVIELRWNSASGADSYEFQRREGSESYPPATEAVDIGAVTDYDDTGIPSNTEYCYQVRTVDGTRKSSWTTERCATTHPDPPANFRAEPGTPPRSVIALAWDRVAGADSYAVRYRTAGGSWGAWTDVGSGTTHSVTGLAEDTGYEFQVRTVVGTATSAEASATARTRGTQPDPPANLRAVRVGRSSLNLEWDAVESADGYRIVLPDGSTPLVSQTMRRVTGLTAGDTYTFQVKTVAGSASSEPSGTLTVTTANPGAPAGLTATAAGNEVTLSWSEGTGAGMWSGPGGSGGYRLVYHLQRRSPAGSGELEDVATVTTGRNYVDRGLAFGREYEYLVRTLAWSDEFQLASGEVATATVTTDLMVPALEARPTSSVSVELSWRAVTGADGYRFEWRVGTQAWNGPVDAGTGTGYEHIGRNPETTYSYRLQAVMGSGYSGWSDAEATTPKLETPEGLSGTATSEAASLSWEEVDAATAYELARREPPDGAFGRPLEVSGTTYEDLKVAAETSYEYRVRGVLTRDARRWESDWTDPPLSLVTPALTLLPPGSLTATVTSAFSVELDWDAVARAESYEIERAQSGRETEEIEVSETRYEDTDLSPETSYTYRVRSLRSGAASAWSSPEDARTWEFAAPTNLTADTLNWKSVYVSWDAVPSAGVRYLTRWRLAASDNWSRVIEAPRSEFWTQGLQPDTEYVYEIRAVYESSAGTLTSDPVEVRFRMPAKPPAPDAPRDLTVAAISATEIELSWTAASWTSAALVEHELRYEVERRIGDGDWKLLDESVTGPSHTDGDLTANTGYSYRVRTVALVDSGGLLRPARLESAWTDSVNTTTDP